MRRVVPWALFALLLVGAGVGAVIGQSAPRPGPTPAQWVAEVVATTRVAGTAHFTDTTITTSRVQQLRGSDSGSGVVDFGTQSVRATDVENSYQWSSTDGGPMHASLVRNVTATVAIGKSSWDRLGGFWTKSPSLGNAGDPLYLPDAVGASSALGAIGGAGPWVGLRQLGPATVGGVVTTRYLLTTARPRPCNATLAAAMNAYRVGPTTLWVDAAGRLVQVQGAIHIDLTILESTLPSFPNGRPSDIPTGREVTTTTLHFDDFGAPVHITAPAVTSQPGSTVSIGGFAVSHAHTC